MKHLGGQCQRCGGRFDFPAEMIGTTGTCPLCGKDTEMMLEKPKMESDVSKRMVVYCILAVAILGFGLVAANIALKRARSMVRKQNPATGIANGSATQISPVGAFLVQTNDFFITAAAIQKTSGNPLAVAYGVVSNGLNRPRLGVQVAFDVLDSKGQKIGTSMDSIILVEPLGKWRFQAPLLQTNASSVCFVSIHEENAQ